ncbi:MAG: hypothetical protein ACQETB_06575 [Halobacteriota archaeon]
MVKSTVRFSETVVSEVESLVEEGYFESKSEFYRFASDYVLEQVVDSYDPATIDYEEIKSEIRSVAAVSAGGDVPKQRVPFFESVVLLRQYALRGNFSDAEDFIDHHYEADDPHALVLEDLLEMYRSRVRSRDESSAPLSNARDRNRSQESH